MSLAWWLPDAAADNPWADFDTPQSEAFPPETPLFGHPLNAAQQPFGTATPGVHPCFDRPIKATLTRYNLLCNSPYGASVSSSLSEAKPLGATTCMHGMAWQRSNS